MDYGCGSGRLTPLDPAQVKKLNQTIRRKRFATTAELLSITQFNTTARTRQGDRARKSLVRVKTNKMNEHNRFEFASVHHRANIKRYISEDECYIGLRSTNQIVLCKGGETYTEKGNFIFMGPY